MRRFVLGTAILLGAACAAPAQEKRAVKTTEELRAVATTASAGGATLTLAVEAWRSFQPIVGEKGDPLIAILRVSSPDGVPGALTVDAVYLARGQDLAQGNAREERPREASARTVEFVLRDGPRWAAGDSIDVVVSVSGLGGPSVLLRAPRVAIARVD